MHERNKSLPARMEAGPTIGGALYFPGVFCAFQCILL
jgi:hypothetical protein